ncbi:hypothetical protein HMPREF3027_04315 [Porphyromonas sp. HMSC077F02]|nr:hypothetical protein HMPREF3027_04315 [Porphyromonas sp. HMSC077F02]
MKPLSGFSLLLINKVHHLLLGMLYELQIFHVSNRNVSRMKSKYFTYQTEMLHVPNIKRAGRDLYQPFTIVFVA